jgi:hypothetical protein
VRWPGWPAYDGAAPMRIVAVLTDRAVITRILAPGPEHRTRPPSPEPAAGPPPGHRRLGRYLDPIVAVPSGSSGWWTPNGHRRLGACYRQNGRFAGGAYNPLRFKRGAKAEFDETIDKMLAAALKFDAGKIEADQAVSAGGAAED